MTAEVVELVFSDAEACPKFQKVLSQRWKRPVFRQAGLWDFAFHGRLVCRATDSGFRLYNLTSGDRMDFDAPEMRSHTVRINRLETHGDDGIDPFSI